MSLSLSSQPGFTDLEDSIFDAGNALSAANLKSLNADAKFAAVRNEQFWGFYRHGETVALPTSPADGYTYSRSELLYSWSIFWTAAAPGALNGTQTPPSRGATSGGGTLLEFGGYVDPSTGAVSCYSDYFSTRQTNTNDGILMVITHAQRDR